MTIIQNDIADLSQNTLSENILLLLKRHNVSSAELAKALDLPYNTVNRLITGNTTDPRISTLQLIADYFDVSIDFLLNDQSNQINRNENFLVPFLSWELLEKTDFKNLKDHTEWVHVPKGTIAKNSRGVFALPSTKSMYPRYPYGTTFIVSTNEKPIDGDIVLIYFESSNAFSLRELIIDSPYWKLKPIIQESDSVLLDPKENKIIGVVILTLIHTRNAT